MEGSAVDDKKTKRQLRNEKLKEQKEKIKEILGVLDTTFSVTNTLVTKSVKLNDGTVLNKKYVMSLQREIRNELEKEFQEQQKAKPVGSTSTRSNNNYRLPLYFKKEFVDWVADSGLKLGRSGVKALANAPDVAEGTVEYKGEQLGDVLVANSNQVIDINNKEVDLNGLASKAIVNTLFNYHLVANKLKGVTKKMPDGTEKVVYNYWKVDPTMRKHFKVYLDDLIKKSKVKDPIVSLDYMPLGAIMALIAKLTDTKRSEDLGKDILADPNLCSVINVDEDLVQALYSQAKGTSSH